MTLQSPASMVLAASGGMVLGFTIWVWRQYFVPQSGPQSVALLALHREAGPRSYAWAVIGGWLLLGLLARWLMPTSLGALSSPTSFSVGTILRYGLAGILLGSGMLLMAGSSLPQHKAVGNHSESWTLALVMVLIVAISAGLVYWAIKALTMLLLVSAFTW